MESWENEECISLKWDSNISEIISPIMMIELKFLLMLVAKN